MVSLSLCMIVKNEEDVIGRCLACVKDIADEIIIIDTGSTDKTKEISAQYTNKIYDFTWIEDFASARNYSFSKATMDYVMWLDADDVIYEKDQQELKSLKETLDIFVDMIMMKYDIAFDENNNPTFSNYRERIFKRSMNYLWVGEIHEVIPQYGKVIYSDIAISHRKIHPNEPERNLKIFNKMLLEGKTLDPRQKYYYGRELFYNGKYEKAIMQFNEFLQEEKGWIENNISACQDLAYCYYQTQNERDAITSLFRSFIYDVPRAEICCDIGKHFLDRKEYHKAIYWYEAASSKRVDEKSCGFILLDSYGYKPYMQLCLCYDRLGNYEKAVEYNEKAGKLKPNDKSYLYNKNYFLNLFKEKENVTNT